MSFEHISKQSEHGNEESGLDTEDAPQVEVADAEPTKPRGFICGEGIVGVTKL